MVAVPQESVMPFRIGNADVLTNVNMELIPVSHDPDFDADIDDIIDNTPTYFANYEDWVNELRESCYDLPDWRDIVKVR